MEIMLHYGGVTKDLLGGSPETLVFTGKKRFFFYTGFLHVIQ